ncbi:MAG: hypothetical protein V5A37_08950 [Halobacteriales archaeon]
MSTDTRNPSDDPVTVGVEATSYDEYAAFTTLGGDELVLYRRTNDRAWLQSDGFVSLDQRR